MTDKKYLTDTYKFQSVGTVTLQDSDERGVYLVFDHTIFYPQGGGQPSDHGLVRTGGKEIDIIHVRQVEGDVRHYIDPLSNDNLIGQELDQLVEESRRVLNARYHSAAHLLGNVVEEMTEDLKAVKGHSFPGEAYVEFMGEADIQTSEVEREVNEAISSDILSKAFEVSQEEFEKKFYKLPYEIPGNKSFRVLQIGEYPPIPCGGTHLNNMKEIGGFTVKKVKIKGGKTKVMYTLA